MLAVNWVAGEEEERPEKVLWLAGGCAQAKGTSCVADWKARATRRVAGGSNAGQEHCFIGVGAHGGR